MPTVYASDPRLWSPVVPGLESDNPPTRIGFDSQWASPMSCGFCMFWSSCLGTLNQATQDVLSRRMGSLCPPVSCLDASSFVTYVDYCTLP